MKKGWKKTLAVLALCSLVIISCAPGKKEEECPYEDFIVVDVFDSLANVQAGLLQHHQRKYLCRPLKAYIFLSNLLFYLLVFYGILWYNVSREGFDDASNHNKIEKC